MLNILRNRYVRVVISANLAVWAWPRVTNLLNWTVPELAGGGGGVINTLEDFSILFVLAGSTAVLLGVAFGAPEMSSSPSSPALPPASPPAGGGS